MKILKPVFIGAFILSSSSAFAQGVQCIPTDSTTKISSNENLITGEAASTIILSVPYIQKEPIVFSKAKKEIASTNDRIVYIASNSNGQALTLLMDNVIKEREIVSTAYIKSGDEVYVELLKCALKEKK